MQLRRWLLTGKRAIYMTMLAVMTLTRSQYVGVLIISRNGEFSLHRQAVDLPTNVGLRIAS
jgi:hypothetical protein